MQKSYASEYKPGIVCSYLINSPEENLRKIGVMGGYSCSGYNLRSTPYFFQAALMEKDSSDLLCQEMW